MTNEIPAMTPHLEQGIHIKIASMTEIVVVKMKVENLRLNFQNKQFQLTVLCLVATSAG